MKFRFFLFDRIIYVVIIFVLGCSGKGEDKFKNPLYFANDFESYDGWCENHQIIKGNAHSGKYSCKIDSANIFSRGFVSKLNQISSTSIKQVDVSAWIKLEKPSAWAKCAVEIRSSKDSIIFWEAGNSNDFLQSSGEWIPVKFNFKLPPFLDPEGVIKVYFMNQKNYGLFIDDLEIIFDAGK